MEDDKVIEEAERESERKKKEVERSNAAREAAVKVEADLKEKLAAAEAVRKAADTGVQESEKAAKAAADTAALRKELAEGKKKRARLQERERAVARAKEQGASADTLAALEKEVVAAKADVPSDARMKELAAQVDKHQQGLEEARARLEAEKQLNELVGKQPAAVQRQAASLTVLKKAVADADQASAALTALHAQIQALRTKLDAAKPSASREETAHKPRAGAGETEITTAT